MLCAAYCRPGRHTLLLTTHVPHLTRGSGAPFCSSCFARIQCVASLLKTAFSRILQILRRDNFRPRGPSFSARTFASLDKRRLRSFGALLPPLCKGVLVCGIFILCPKGHIGSFFLIFSPSSSFFRCSTYTFLFFLHRVMFANCFWPEASLSPSN